MTNPHAEHEHFVSLVRLCREDSQMKQTIFRMLDLPDFQRSSVIGMMSRQMTDRGADAELIEALTALKDPAVASATRDILRKEIGNGA